MSDSSRYDILFEPVQIGPVIAKNRFYQVPHCTGLGWIRPRMLTELRSVKAQGGWGVVCTEYCSIHPNSDDMPYPYQSLWDDRDIKFHAQMTEKVHQHGALAGVELWMGGPRASNLFSREIPVSVDNQPNSIGHPWQSRKMDRKDIKNLRLWHKKAALRAKAADFDIVYVYATHDYLLTQFLSSKTNNRCDEYGGSLENRVRLVKELIEETKGTVGDRCAVAVRFSIDDPDYIDGQPLYNEQKDMFHLLAELPDLWDINIADYSYEMGVSRFVQEAALEPYMSFVKSATSKPVVTVGRFTSPDTMVSQVKQGITDFIGAARPSIADPYIPNKIKAGRYEDIRECIGCNICYAADGLAVPIRCTQNPTMGEEWRRGWHPEIIEQKGSDAEVLVVGGGPAGLEAARVLGERGYQVTLAEASKSLGGRVTKESSLPGLAEWSRVRDYRITQLNKMNNVGLYLSSHLTAANVIEFNADHVLIATGAKWRADGFGRNNLQSFSMLSSEEKIFTPDQIMDDLLPKGKVMVFDDDSYYMASVIAEKIAGEGCDVTYVTPDDKVSSWSYYTDEQHRVHRRLVERNVSMITAHNLKSFNGEFVELSCVYSEQSKSIAADSIVLVTAREPVDKLYYELEDYLRTANNSFTVSKIGDCDAPSIIADAVYAGHRWARELDQQVDYDNPIKYDRVEI